MKSLEISHALQIASQKALAELEPFFLIEEGYLTIKTKDAELKRFYPNKAQLHLLLKIKELFQQNKIVRILVLKARQLGISTLIEAIIYAFTSQRKNVNSLVLAHDKDGSDYIFEMSKMYQEQLEDHLRPLEKKSNQKKLEFDGIHSQILIDTANNLQAGRGMTVRIAHLSEYAFFKDAKTLMLGLSQAVPTLPQTMIIKETTANGFNFFRDEWEQAVAGKSDYVPIFIPWYWSDDYMMAEPNFVLGDSNLAEVSKEEPALHKQLEAEGIKDIELRLSWRRYCIKNNCDGKVSTFKQEYPSNPEEAFLASGECFFDKEQLIKMLRRAEAKKPAFKADIVQVNGKFEVRKSEEGIFAFYEPLNMWNKIEGEFIVTGDAASGSGADWSVLEARRKVDNKQVVLCRGKFDVDQMAMYAMLLAGFLSEAMIAIENDKFGFAVNRVIKERYGNIYKQRVVNKDTLSDEVTERFGWDTTSITRPLILSALQEDIRQGAIEINDVVAVKECLTFIKNPDSKKVEAELNCNDDCVIAMAINSYLRRLYPYIPKVEREYGVDIHSLPKNAAYSYGRK